MKVLAVETATAVCGAAVVENGAVCAEEIVEAEQVHAQKLMVLVEEVLRSSGLRAQELGGIAVSIGPGSFTGLRIGLSTAKGLAFALEKPLAAVSTLEAIAANVLRSPSRAGEGELILPLIDARRDEVYAALYRVRSGRPEEVLSPRAASLAQLAGLLGEGGPILAAGDATEKFFRFITEARPGLRPRLAAAPPERARCSPAAVGILGERRLAGGCEADIASLEPVYLKEFVTTMKPQSVEGR